MHALHLRPLEFLYGAKLLVYEFSMHLLYIKKWQFRSFIRLTVITSGVHIVLSLADCTSIASIIMALR